MPTRRIVWILCCSTLLGVLALHAYVLYFQCDDAYISYRYARNLKDGLGLVFNPGEYVEGYTNFSWTVLLSATWAATGIGPDQTAVVYSSLCTVGVFAILIALARYPAHPRSDLASLIAALLWVTNRTAAVWTSSGLETRLFTLLVLASLAMTRFTGRRAALGMSALLGLAELTRPEALLYGPMVLGWTTLSHAHAHKWRPADLAARWAPFGMIVAAHFGFRLWYYGALLPNTFAAKGKAVWYEGGASFLASVGIEYGLFLLLPVAALGAFWRWRSRGDDLLLLGGLMVTCDLVFVARIGGDHFESRMFDLAFVLLSIGIAEGVLCLTQRAKAYQPLLAAPVVAILVFYQSVIPWMHHQATHEITERRGAMHVAILPEHAPWAYRAPLVPWMAGTFNSLQHWNLKRMIGTRMVEHRNFWARQVDRFAAYDLATRRPLPQGLVAADGVMGVLPFYLSDITFVDKWGLTDKIVPTLPVVQLPRRQLAHTRRDVSAYLDSRRNIVIDRPFPTAAEAARRMHFAVRLADGVWMPFDRGPERFGGHEIASSIPLAPGTLMLHQGKSWEVVGVFEDFEKTPSWSSTGDAFSDPTGMQRRHQGVLSGVVGDGVLNSFHSKLRDKATGILRSPNFQLQEGEAIAFLVAGGADEGVGVRLFVEGELRATVRGKDNERLQVKLLEPGPGTAMLEIFDETAGPWGHVLVDQIAIVKRRL